MAPVPELISSIGAAVYSMSVLTKIQSAEIFKNRYSSTFSYLSYRYMT